MALPIVPIAMALAQFAPTLLRYFGAGEASAQVAEKVVDIAQAVTGGKTPEEALAKMREDAAAQRQFDLAVMQREGELEQAYIQDRANARERDLEIQKARGRNTRGDILAYLAVGALIGTIATLFLVTEIPDSSEKLLYSLLGALIMIVKDVYSFEFGSSKDSQRNAQAVADMLKQG